jgi:Tfp pilus assembly protein PilN
MRIPVNLASQPFRHDRAVLVGSGAVGVLLAVLLVFLISVNTLESGQAAETRKEIDGLEKRMQTITADQARQDAILRRPENAAVLDLEKVVPYNVRIISIRPFVTGQGQVSLDMLVGAESTPPLIEMLKNLESSPRFGATYSHSQVPPTQSEKLYRYRVTVTYAQNL